MVIKSQTLDGKYAPFVPGWDCHGLPIELNVEKKVGKVGHKVSASEFREECRKYASSQIELQKKDFKRLGILGDWDNPYVTKLLTPWIIPKKDFKEFGINSRNIIQYRAIDAGVIIKNYRKTSKRKSNVKKTT